DEIRINRCSVPLLYDASYLTLYRTICSPFNKSSLHPPCFNGSTRHTGIKMHRRISSAEKGKAVALEHIPAPRVGRGRVSEPTNQADSQRHKLSL
ncbi:unnamed protein product, partial [Brassica oleracea var. botrytis]